MGEAKRRKAEIEALKRSGPLEQIPLILMHIHHEQNSLRILLR